MFDVVPLAAGAAVIALSVFHFARDCRGNVSSTMGGEMTFSSLWNLGWTLFCIGLFPLSGISRLWTLAAVPVMFAVSFIVRSRIQRYICIPPERELNGFQKFIRKTESSRKGP